MPQKTLVVQLPPASHGSLRARLEAGNFEFRTAPHAFFQAKGEGCVATFYRSGKLVIQGATAEMFLSRHTELTSKDVIPPKKSRPRADDAEAERIDVPLIGSDEAGKGDYFGPLVVASVRVTPEETDRLRELGVADSKTVTDRQALALGSVLRKTVDYAIHRLDPPKYNDAYSRWKNLNPMLADMHATAIKKLAHPGDEVLIDQFAAEHVMERALANVDVTIRQMPKAERNLAVAAASILARQEFLACLNDLSHDAGFELKKGGGSLVDQAAVDFVRENGFEALETVAKLHFKNTQKIREALSRR